MLSLTKQQPALEMVVWLLRSSRDTLGLSPEQMRTAGAQLASCETDVINGRETS